MAWNQYYIFVKGPNFDGLDLDAVLARLNLSAYKPVEEVNLGQASKPKTLFAGVYNGNLVLAHPDLVYKFFEPKQSEEEQLFIETFPDAEIAALEINESVSCFGFALIVNGEKIRSKNGCDGQVYNDFGATLPEESEVLAEEIYSLDDLEDMRDGGMSEEEIEAQIKFEASYRVPNRLTRRYLGKSVLQCDISTIRLTKYARG